MIHWIYEGIILPRIALQKTLLKFNRFSFKILRFVITWWTPRRIIWILIFNLWYALQYLLLFYVKVDLPQKKFECDLLKLTFSSSMWHLDVNIMIKQAMVSNILLILTFADTRIWSWIWLNNIGLCCDSHSFQWTRTSLWVVMFRRNRNSFGTSCSR